MKTVENTLYTTAIFSDNYDERYLLRKTWDENKKRAAVLMIFPASNDILMQDLTTTLVMNNLNKLDFGGFDIINLTAKINPTAKEISEGDTTANDEQIRKSCEEADVVIICWGTAGQGNKKISARQMPQVFDELSMFIGNLTDLIYTLSNGKEKARMNKDCSMKSSENWATTIITTGEKNILSDSKQNAGLSARTLIFDSVKWTENAKHAERIAKVIESNYGFASLDFAEYLMEADCNTIFKKLEYWRNKYLAETSVQDQFTDRISKKYAILLTTASIAKEALQLKFSTKRILRFILKNEAKSDIERDLGIKAYNLFLEYVETNPYAFGTKFGNNWTDAKSNQNLGIVEKLKDAEEIQGKEYKKHIIIAKTKFNTFCNQYGFEDPTIVLKNWKEKGLLKSEKDRLVSDKKISSTGNAIKCYVIRVEAEEATTSPTNKKYTRTSGQTGKDDFSIEN